MFGELFTEAEAAKAQLTLENSVFGNTLLEDFSEYVIEADSEINALTESYRNVMRKALLEADSGEVAHRQTGLPDSAKKIASQANEHVGGKIRDAIIKLAKWIAKIFGDFIKWLKGLTDTNKAFLAKVKPIIDGMSAEEIAKVPAMTANDYRPSVIDLAGAKRIVADNNKFAAARVSKETLDEAKAIISSIRADKGLISDAGRVTAGKKIVSGVSSTNWADFKKEVIKKATGEKKKFQFSKAYLNKVEELNKHLEIVSKDVEAAKRALEDQVKLIHKNAELATHVEDAAIRSTAEEMSNVQRQLVTTTTQVILDLADIKSRILKKQAATAKAFCNHAARYAKGSKGADTETSKAVVVRESVSLFDPLFEADIDGSILEAASIILEDNGVDTPDISTGDEQTVNDENADE